VQFDYSKIRPEGLLLKGFGGISSGPDPLRNLHVGIRQVLEKSIDKAISSRTIVDLMNLIGKCIVAGNIRRTAEIAFGDADDDDFLNLKNYSVNPEREAFGWTSNNSVFARIGMDYSKACSNVRRNGEPGFCWLENMRAYGRMGDPPNYKDSKAAGGNPCLEQTLESYEMCCLVETFPANHASYEEFEDTLKYAYMYAKTVTLGLSHWDRTNEVITRNRRIGCSMSGIAQFLGRFELHTLREWCHRGYDFLQAYDKQLATYFTVSASIKMTCIKPSGTVSLLAGATPGVHYPESQYYIRRVRFSRLSELYEPLLKAGYKIEKDNYSTDGQAMVVEIPVSVGENVRTLADVSMWEQLALTAFLQENWADNQVSCTIMFDPETEGPHIPRALAFYQYKLKGISFLPKLSPGQTVYTQLPYEQITEETYHALMQNIKELQYSAVASGEANDPKPENFCDSAKCTIAIPTAQT
jgi:ribonucleoside-triphosphate reductase